jgi:hypothetical protein
MTASFSREREGQDDRKYGSPQQTRKCNHPSTARDRLAGPNAVALDARPHRSLQLLADNPWTERPKRQPANGNWTVTVPSHARRVDDQESDDQNQRRYADLDATITLVYNDFLAEIGITQRSA